LPGFTGGQYASLGDMLKAQPEIAAISIASPTMTHAALAREAMEAKRHVLLEKPPTTTLAELQDLRQLAAAQRLVLCTGFHARHNPAVEQTRALLADASAARPDHIAIEWREDFDRWHPGQTWPWKEGGFGVFDPGINALSILCHILPETEFKVQSARFDMPAGSATPSRVEMRLGFEGGSGHVVFEWRKGGTDVWDIAVQRPTGAGRRETLLLHNVRTLMRNGEVIIPAGPDEEYAGVYREFAAALASGTSQASTRELAIIEAADAIAERHPSPISF
jgi:predicted dehydrogenase